MFTADLLERAAKTFGQAFFVAFLGSVVASVTPGIDWSVAWWQSVGLAAAAAGATAGVSAITSLLSKPFGAKGSASLLKSNPIDVESSVRAVTLEPVAQLGQLAPPVAPVGYTLVHDRVLEALLPNGNANIAVPKASSDERIVIRPAGLPAGSAPPLPNAGPVDPALIPGYGLPAHTPPVSADYGTTPVQSAHATQGQG